jgi:hypothetical protein
MISRLLLGTSRPREDFPGMRWMRTDSAPRARDHLADLNSGIGIEFVGGDDRAGMTFPDLALHPELAKLLLDPPFFLQQLVLVDLFRGLARVEKGEGRELIHAGRFDSRKKRLGGRLGGRSLGSADDEGRTARLARLSGLRE